MKTIRLLCASVLAALALDAGADVITDWNIKTGELVTEARLGTPPAVRLMAFVQTAAYRAVDTITQRYPGSPSAADASRSSSIEAAVAAAHRATLSKLLPAQKASIDAAYNAALTLVADGPAKAAGIAIGEKAAAEVLAARLDDGAASPEDYRPHTSAGAYVPTAAAAIPQWPRRKPWLLDSAAQFRPGPPPALASEQWARDYNEVKELGGRVSARRSAEQTEVARFWDYSLPAIYHGVVRSVALQPGRDVARNARLLALTAQAMDDALISVFDAKYHYHFWRPATAIRNGDIDGNDATPRDASWASLIDAPMHPEYPSAHSTLAATVGALLKADSGGVPVAALSTISPTAKGATRRWTRVEDFVQEVSDARVYGGIHFRAATKAGEAIGQQIGELAARSLQLPH